MASLSPIPASELPSLLNQIVHRFEFASLRDALKAIELVLMRDGFAANFRNASAANGSPWAPRKNPRLTHPLLILTGRLFLSATSTFGEDHIQRIRDREITTGTSTPYAIFHQHGTSKMPARPFLDASEPVLAACREIASDALFEEMTRGLVA